MQVRRLTRRAVSLLPLVLLVGCGAEATTADRLEPRPAAAASEPMCAVDPRPEPTPEPVEQEPQPAPVLGAETAPTPPNPDEYGPDGEPLPGTPNYEPRQQQIREFEELKEASRAAGRALAPKVDRFARADARTADLLVGATYDRAGAMPIGDGTRFLGAVLVYTLPEPRDFFLDKRCLDGSLNRDDDVIMVRWFGVSQLRVGVNLEWGHLSDVSALDGQDVITYDADGNELLSSFDAPG